IFKVCDRQVLENWSLSEANYYYYYYHNDNFVYNTHTHKKIKKARTKTQNAHKKPFVVLVSLNTRISMNTKKSVLTCFQ
ncbi:unnamed protein product, partial [marine sediment metagenome]